MAIERFLEDHRDDITAELADWVSIPSVAGVAQHAVDVTRSAHWLAGVMRGVGLRTEVLPAGDSSAVFAEWPVHRPGAPTVLIYSHHDVRHAKPEEWRQTDPFRAAVRDGRLYGRGASDAKGQVIAHVWGLRAHLAGTADRAPAVNLKFLVEGEEEVGSPNLKDLLRRHRSLLECDLVVFSDTVQWQADAPAIVTSMRGTILATLTVTGPDRDVHSGVVSGASPNPVHVLADLIHAFHDGDRRIMLPGFYDPVEALTPRRRRDLEDLPFDEQSWAERTETGHVIGEPGYTPKERLWARPSLEVLSVLAGDPDGVPRAVIPSTAEASISIRTVPNQRVHEVADQLRAFVRGHMPDSVSWELDVDELTPQEAYVTPDGPALDALARAVKRGFGEEAVGRMGNAGGGPADLLATTFDAPVVFFGTGLPEDHWHAGDESVDLAMLLRGAASLAHLWQELGEASPEELRGSRG